VSSPLVPTPPSRRFATSGGMVLAVLLVAAGLAAWRQVPPAPRPAEAPDDVFSARRAYVLLEQLVGDGIPHPNGSPQNDVVRERILGILRGMGCEPEVQEAVVDRRGRPFTVRNVMVRLPGTGAGRNDADPNPASGTLSGRERSAVLLMAHYDSVPEGPGASDDGVSVAVILEVARILRTAPPPRNDVILLITDAEEYGLLGVVAGA